MSTGSSPPGTFHYVYENESDGYIEHMTEDALKKMHELEAVVALYVGPVTKDRFDEACNHDDTDLKNNSKSPEPDPTWTNNGWIVKLLQTVLKLQRKHGEPPIKLCENRSKSAAKLLPHVILKYQFNTFMEAADARGSRTTRDCRPRHCRYKLGKLGIRRNSDIQ